jgi:hypothetical protein
VANLNGGLTMERTIALVLIGKEFCLAKDGLLVGQVDGLMNLHYYTREQTCQLVVYTTSRRQLTLSIPGKVKLHVITVVEWWRSVWVLDASVPQTVRVRIRMEWRSYVE